MAWRGLAAAFAAVLLLGTAAASADEARAAVAANFTNPVKEIAAAFKKATGDDVVFSFGPSGAFYEQIKQGAPFQIFLSADQKRPQTLEKDGLAVAGSEFTYAVGKLVLWSAALDVGKGDDVLKANGFQKLAIANPAGAPYGTAAVETLKALKIYDAVAPKIVQGNSIAQTFQFVETGNAQLGFVALSQLAKVTTGSRWLVPQSLYKPIRQDAVLLKTGADSKAAKGFLAFLKGPQARAIIEKYGYGLE